MADRRETDFVPDENIKKYQSSDAMSRMMCLPYAMRTDTLCVILLPLSMLGWGHRH
jgi:hypothetical protein